MWDPSADPFTLFPSNNQLIFSKQSIMMLLASAIIILLFIVGYKKDQKVQSGIGNLLEVFVVFIRDEVVYPNMGEKQGKKIYLGKGKYGPYLQIINDKDQKKNMSLEKYF